MKKKHTRKRSVIDATIIELAWKGLNQELSDLRLDITNAPISHKDRVELLKGLLGCYEKLTSSLRKELERRGMSADEIQKQMAAIREEKRST